MITKYVKSASERISKFQIPAHPHYSRSRVLPDGSIEVLNTFDEVPGYDPVVYAPVVTFTDFAKAGEMPPKIGAASVNRLGDLSFADSFRSAFEAAGAVAPPESPVPSSPDVVPDNI